MIKTIDYKEMNLPKSLFTIEVPSWHAVIQPLKDYALAQYQRQTGQIVKELTDEILLQLTDIPADTVNDFEVMGAEVYKNSQAQYHFYQVVLPAVLSEYAKKAEIAFDEQELTDYVDMYLEKVTSYAEENNSSLEDYGRTVMGIDGDVTDEFKRRAHEDFIFKVIASAYFAEMGGSTDELAYEAFIQQNVLNNQADPIELKERLPYDVFVLMMPEMHLSQEIYDYFLPQIEFVVNPDAPLQFNQ